MQKKKKIIVDTKKALLIHEIKTREKISQVGIGKRVGLNYNTINKWQKIATESIIWLYNILKITGTKFEDIVTEVEINNN